MSRVYSGLFSCLLVWDGVDGEVFGHSLPSTYEACQELLFVIGLGAPYEGHRVTRALIVAVTA